MAVPILRLNIDDNPRIIVKQDSIPVTITGYTQTIVQGSGATTVTESGVNPKIYTVYTPIGSAQWGSILGDVTTQTDLTDYVTQSISAATSGLTSSWNEITDKPQWLDYDVKEEFQTGHTHSYNNLDDLPSLFSGDYDDLTNKPDLSIYLTGYTVTADDVTGITASLYAPIIHTHPYSGLTGLPSLFSGDYDDLTNKPDLSVYQPVSGMSIYLTGVTWNDVTNKPDLTLQADFTGHTSDLTIHYPQSGISITESQISDLQDYALQSAINTYTGTTAPASFLPITGLTGYWTSGQTVDYVTGYTPTLEWGNITGTISGQTDLWSYLSGNTGGVWGTITGELSGQTDLQDALNQKVDYPIYHDDLQTIGDDIDELNAFLSTYTGTTIPNLISIFVSGNTSLGSGTSIVGAKSGRNVTNKSIKVAGSLGISGTTTDITIYTTSEGVWGSITGTLSEQTDLYNALNQKVDYPIYHDDLQTISDEIDALITGVTANTASINAIDLSLYQPVSGMSLYQPVSGMTAYLTGITCSDVTGCTDGLYLPITGLTGYWTSAQTENYVTGLGYITGYTVTADDVTGITATLYSPTAHTHTGVYMPFTTTIVSLTASTILDSTYANKIVEIDSTGATTITLYSGATTGTRIDIINVNTGDVTIAAQGTLQGVGTILATQYTKAEAYNRGNDVWLITGTLTS